MWWLQSNNSLIFRYYTCMASMRAIAIVFFEKKNFSSKKEPFKTRWASRHQLSIISIYQTEVVIWQLEYQWYDWLLKRHQIIRLIVYHVRHRILNSNRYFHTFPGVRVQRRYAFFLLSTTYSGIKKRYLIPLLLKNGCNTRYKANVW